MMLSFAVFSDCSKRASLLEGSVGTAKRVIVPRLLAMAKKNVARRPHRLYTLPGLARYESIAGCRGMVKLATAHETIMASQACRSTQRRTTPELSVRSWWKTVTGDAIGTERPAGGKGQWIDTNCTSSPFDFTNVWHALSPAVRRMTFVVRGYLPRSNVSHAKSLNLETCTALHVIPGTGG